MFPPSHPILGTSAWCGIEHCDCETVKAGPVGDWPAILLQPQAYSLGSARHEISTPPPKQTLSCANVM